MLSVHVARSIRVVRLHLRHRPVARAIAHSRLLHRLRCPSPSASSINFIYPLVVHLIHPLRLLSSSPTSSIYSTSSAPTCTVCSHRPFPYTFMITLHSADTSHPEQPVTTAVPKTQHADNVHLTLFQKCPISGTCPFSDTHGRTLSSAPYTFPSTHLPKVSSFPAFSPHLPKVR